jgi:hypothetical protein
MLARIAIGKSWLGKNRSRLMSPHAAAEVVAILAVGILAWYLYQIGSRKKKRVRYKVKIAIVLVVVYAVGVLILLQRKVPVLEACLISGFCGLGCAWLLVKAPRQDRRIPRAVWREVVARDLTSKGLKWDPAKYNMDHIVPFSRGGDNSPRNLRVIEKHKNLRKGRRMPGLRDFLSSRDKL